jgi:hypothetical protein
MSQESVESIRTGDLRTGDLPLLPFGEADVTGETGERRAW